MDAAPDAADSAADVSDTALADPDSAADVGDEADAAADAAVLDVIDVADAATAVADAVEDVAAADDAAVDAPDAATPPCEPAQCADGNDCTLDGCDGFTCVHLPVASTCSDGNACNATGTCAAGVCLAASATASDSITWSHVVGSNGFDSANAIAVDGLGRGYVAGPFAGSVDFGGAVTDTTAGTNYLASYAATGSLRWVTPLCSSLLVRAVAVDRSGNSYVVGTATGGCSVQGVTVVAANSGTAGLILAIDPDGTLRWWRSGSDGVTGTGITAVACDPAGNVYWAGNYAGSLATPGGTFSSGYANGFVVSLDSSGGWRWGRAIGGGLGYLNTLALAVDPAGRATVGGYFYDQADFGSGAKAASYMADGWLVGLDANGGWRWDRQLHAAYVDVMALGSDGAGNVYATGCFDSVGDFGGGTVYPGGGAHVWLASYDGNGGYRWSNPFPTFFAGIGLAVDATPGGDVAIAFSYYGGNSLPGISGLNGLGLARFSGSGGFSWARGVSGAYPGGVAVGASGSTWFCGAFSGSADFGSGPVASNSGSFDVFLARYGSACDDGDPCTLDACNATSGCSHTAISPCADVLCAANGAACWGSLAVQCDALGLGYTGTPTDCAVSGMTCTGGTCTSL